PLAEVADDRVIEDLLLEALHIDGHADAVSPKDIVIHKVLSAGLQTDAAAALVHEVVVVNAVPANHVFAGPVLYFILRTVETAVMQQGSPSSVKIDFAALDEVVPPAEMDAVVAFGPAVMVNAAVHELMVVAGRVDARTAGVSHFAIDQADMAGRRLIVVRRFRLQRQRDALGV